MGNLVRFSWHLEKAFCDIFCDTLYRHPRLARKGASAGTPAQNGLGRGFPEVFEGELTKRPYFAFGFPSLT